MPTNYERGRRAEYRVRQALRELGYPLVVRAAGSKGLADVIAIDNSGKGPLLIQVKSGDETLSPDERQKLAVLALTLPLCRVEVWHWKDRRWEITHFGGVGSPEGELVRIAGKGEA